MVLVVYGFPTKKEALVFEWHWQQPFKSKIMRDTARALQEQKLGNQWKLRFKIRLLFEMLQINPWNRFPLAIQWLGRNPTNTVGLFPSLPDPPVHIKQIYAPVTQLDMMLERASAEEDDPGLVSGEDEHSDHDSPASDDEMDTRSNISRPTTNTATNQATGTLRANTSDPSHLPHRPLAKSTSIGAKRPGITMDLTEDDEDGAFDWNQNFLAPQPTSLPLDEVAMDVDISSSQPSTFTTQARLNGAAGAPKPRRSLSANAILPHPDYHNDSIDDDDDSFLNVPAFVPRSAKPTNAAAKLTSTSCASATAKPSASSRPIASLQVSSRTSAASGPSEQPNARNMDLEKRAIFNRNGAASTSSTGPVRASGALSLDVRETVANGQRSEQGDAVNCMMCEKVIEKQEHGVVCPRAECYQQFHIICLAIEALKAEREASETEVTSLIPTKAQCPRCGVALSWMLFIRHKQRNLSHPMNPLSHIK